MNTFFLDILQQYGYPILWVIVFVASAGIPISGTLLLFASGAFAAFGDFNIFILFPLTLSAAILGDSTCYLIGHRIGEPLLKWLERQKRIRFITPQRLEQGRVAFRKRAAWTIFITRFLLVALGGPVNLIAGLEQYTYPRFLLWDTCGQILGAAIPLGLGFVFAQSWEEVASIFGAVSGLLLAVLATAIIGGLLVRTLRIQKHATKASIAAIPDTQKASEPKSLPNTPSNEINTTFD